MAPSSGSKGKGHGPNGSTANTDMSAAAEALNAKLSRKRTKTGCLTCRRRRIKCGEERPICRNCIKSKRHCEGYAQRVVFKTPQFDYDYRPTANGAHITFQAGPLQGQPDPYPQGYPPNAVNAPHGGFQQVPVDPYTTGFANSEYTHGPFTQHALSPTRVFQGGPVHGLTPGYIPQPVFPQQTINGGLPAPYHPLVSQYHEHPHQVQTAPGFGPPINFTSQQVETATPAFAHERGQPNWQGQYLQSHDEKWQYSSPTTTATLERISPASARSSNTIPWNNASSSENPSPAWPSSGYVHQPELGRSYTEPPVPPQWNETVYDTKVPPPVPVDDDTSDLYEHFPNPHNTTDFLAQAAVETQDDDYFDVQSDEEMEVETAALSSADIDRQRTLHTILQINNISIQDLQTRRYDTFIYDGILTHYKAEEVASPLRNPATARVFAHFISVTGPSLSIYERHPVNTSVLFTEGQIPFSQQGLWTFTMPMAALHHQGLLHAMLALASLHIARLQGASLHPSMQHYAWSLRRIHSCVKNAKKRYKLTTIAATMLLGFYEIMTADHLKWNMHLTGSKQLFLETDFVTMARQFKRMKAERQSRQNGARRRNSVPQDVSPQDEILDQIYDVDERVVSEFAGKEVRYDDHGQILTQKSTMPPKLDLTQFEILRDLYWWYLKQDAYQSIVSGNPLLLDYSRWTNCPPRAPLGKSDAIYGSYDHLILLLGRIANFAAKDRNRKLKQMEANGGHWIPPPWLKMQMPTQQAPPPTPVSASSTQPMSGNQFPRPQNPDPPPPAMPQFYGMAPPPRENVRMPSSYAPANSIPTPDTASPQEFNDFAALQAAKDAAMEEYGRIRAALLVFERSLGYGFQPLSSDHYPPMETPFGDALQYRSYDIGVLWAMYHMAVIIAIRSHPEMHPAAHAAAAISANQTHHHANNIGRIAAGIVPGPSDQPLNPTLGSSLCESCMPSFFAAIQYHNAEQRYHTVMRIFSIAQRTGWGSAELIAHGCETAWVKAAQAKRGPPYTRILRGAESEDPRKNGSWENVDPNSAPDQNNEADRRFVPFKSTARLNWAIGIMGTEADEALQITK